MDEQTKSDHVRKAIDKIGSVGSKAIGATIGAVVAKESGMPMAGAIVSAYLSEQLKDVYGLVIEGKIAARKRKRAGDAALAIANDVTARLDAGDSVRSDGFFDRDLDDRSSADETLEAALDAAMSAYEEQKITFIANLTSAICFDKSIDAALAQRLISVLRNLSLRSMMIVAACDDVEILGFKERPHVGTEMSSSTEALHSEYFSLVTLNLIQRIDNKGGYVVDVLSSNGIDPAQMRTTKLGAKLCELSKLGRIRNLPAWQQFIEVAKESTFIGTHGRSMETGVYDGRAAAEAIKEREREKRSLEFQAAVSRMNSY